VLVEGAEEHPRWRRTVTDEAGNPVRVEELTRRPVVLPRGHRLTRLAYPELVPDPREGPEQALDDDGEPLVILGADVLIDKRLRRGPGAKKLKRRPRIG
jgi:hypothetical protein